MINILELVKKEASNPSLDSIVFENLLKELGLDNDTIDDCLAMPSDRREWLLTYFEGKK